MEVQETAKIRELHRVICEIPEKRSDGRLESRKKLKPSGHSWAIVSRRILPAKLTNWLLYELRTKWEVRTYQWESEEISGNETPNTGGKFRRGPITDMEIPLGI